MKNIEKIIRDGVLMLLGIGITISLGVLTIIKIIIGV